MSKAEKYRRQAANCLLMAEDAASSAHRSRLIMIAAALARLAEQAERNDRAVLVYETPGQPTHAPVQ